MTQYHKRKVSFMFPTVLLFGFAIWKFTYGSNIEDNNQECLIKVNKLGKRGVTVFGYYEETWEQKTLRGLCNFKSSDRTNLMVLLSFFLSSDTVNRSILTMITGLECGT